MGILTPDIVTYDLTHPLSAVTLHERFLELCWQDHLRSRFHYIWLRDNCAAPQSINPITREQTYDICQVPEDIHPERADITAEGALRIVWAHDRHESLYHPGWLREHRYDNRAPTQANAITWDARFQVPRFSGTAVLSDDAALHDWLLAQRESGLTLLEGIPCEVDKVLAVAERIGVVRETNFGRRFDVIPKPDADSNAYTTLTLPLHTDLPTRELQPGLQLLHCLENSALGGESVMADGFRIAEALREEQPQAFATLTTLPWDFHNRAKTSDYRWRAPLIAVDRTGKVTEIRIASFLRGPLSAPFEQVEKAYAAYRVLNGYLNDARFRVTFSLRPGDCLVFDNRRVLHARTAYDPATGERRLSGCYVDRDELESRIRILERQRTAAATAAPANTFSLEGNRYFSSR